MLIHEREEFISIKAESALAEVVVAGRPVPWDVQCIGYISEKYVKFWIGVIREVPCEHYEIHAGRMVDLIDGVFEQILGIFYHP